MSARRFTVITDCSRLGWWGSKRRCTAIATRWAEGLKKNARVVDDLGNVVFSIG